MIPIPACPQPIQKEKYILTPKGTDIPKINNPLIYGARPGSPFLWSVMATGAQPMIYEAIGLPKGLAIDKATGFITGKTELRGNFNIQLKAINKHALASILCNHHIPAFSINAGELLHFQHPVLNSGTLLICISQSGESYEVVKLVSTISSDITIVTISNEEDSFLARHSAYTLLSKAGKEDMTSTKTFICTYLVSYLLCNTIAQIAINYSVLYKLADRAEETLLSMICANEPSNYFIEKSLDIFQNTSFVQLIARGTDFTTVSQSALMFMEATKTPASAMLGGEFRHELFEIPCRADYDYNYFVKLELRSSEGKLLSDNLYWFYSQHADYSWLAALEKPLLERTVKVKKEMGEYVYEVKLANKSSKLSFFNHLALADEHGERILPVFWSDNFITLFPGEEKTLIARFAATDAHDKLPGLVINGD